MNYIKSMYLHNKDYYINEDMFNVAIGSREMIKEISGAKIICLTWATDDTVRIPKQAFLDKYFGDAIDEMIIIGDRNGKVNFMKRYIEVMGIDKEDVLLVDDHPDTRYEAHLNDFDTLSASAMSILFSSK